MPSEIIYRLREELEDKDSSQSGGLNALITAQGLVVYTRINATGDWYKERPRVDLKCSIGNATGRRFACADNVPRYDAFHFALAIQVVTEPRNTAANNELHEQMCGIVRNTISSVGGNNSLADVLNFPNVLIPEVLKDSGVSDSAVDEKDGLEYTTMSWDGIVAIRPTAWNN